MPASYIKCCGQHIRANNNAMPQLLCPRPPPPADGDFHCGCWLFFVLCSASASTGYIWYNTKYNEDEQIFNDQSVGCIVNLGSLYRACVDRSTKQDGILSAIPWPSPGCPRILIFCRAIILLLYMNIQLRHTRYLSTKHLSAGLYGFTATTHPSQQTKNDHANYANVADLSIKPGSCAPQQEAASGSIKCLSAFLQQVFGAIGAPSSIT